MAVSASVRRRAGVPWKNSATHAIHASTSCGTIVRKGSRPAAASPFASKKSANTGSASALATTGQAARTNSR